MSGKAGWMTGAMLSAALLAQGTAMAQTAPRGGYSYPEAGDRQPQDDRYADDDLAGGEEQDTKPSAQPRANDDFSDVTGEPCEQARTDAGTARDDRRYTNADDARRPSPNAPSPRVKRQSGTAALQRCGRCKSREIAATVMRWRAISMRDPLGAPTMARRATSPALSRMAV